MLNKYKNILTFDTETTGLNFLSSKIIEFGCLYEEEEYNELLQWDNIKELPKVIVDLTKITMDQINDIGKPSKEVIDEMKDMFENSDLIVAYNLPFDITMVENNIKHYYPDFDFNNLDCDYLDVLAIIRDYKQFNKRAGETHKLESACKKWNVELNGAHRAINDVIATKDLLNALIKDGIPVEKYINRIGYYSSYGIDPHIKIIDKCDYYSQGFKAEKYILNALDE